MPADDFSRCDADHAFCRCCPERCFSTEEPVETAEPGLFERLVRSLSRWAARAFLKAQGGRVTRIDGPG